MRYYGKDILGYFSKQFPRALLSLGPVYLQIKPEASYGLRRRIGRGGAKSRGVG